MEISAEKTKLMSNNPQGITSQINIGNQKLEAATQFKYLGAVISEEGSRPQIMTRIVQTTAALARLKPIWRDQNITLKAQTHACPGHLYLPVRMQFIVTHS